MEPHTEERAHQALRVSLRARVAPAELGAFLASATGGGLGGAVEEEAVSVDTLYAQAATVVMQRGVHDEVAEALRQRPVRLPTELARDRDWLLRQRAERAGKVHRINLLHEERVQTALAVAVFFAGFAVFGAAWMRVNPGGGVGAGGASRVAAAVAPADPCAGRPSATWYRDADGDGRGDDADRVEGCEAPEGYVARGGDCDDQVAWVRPGLTACMLRSFVHDGSSDATVACEQGPVAGRLRARGYLDRGPLGAWLLATKPGEGASGWALLYHREDAEDAWLAELPREVGVMGPDPVSTEALEVGWVRTEAADALTVPLFRVRAAGGGLGVVVGEAAREAAVAGGGTVDAALGWALASDLGCVDAP